MSNYFYSIYDKDKFKMEHIHPDLEARTQMLVKHNAKTKGKVSVKLMHDAAKLPTKANRFDAGGIYIQSIIVPLIPTADN